MNARRRTDVDGLLRSGEPGYDPKPAEWRNWQTHGT